MTVEDRPCHGRSCPCVVRRVKWALCNSNSSSVVHLAVHRVRRGTWWYGTRPSWRTAAGGKTGGGRKTAPGRRILEFKWTKQGAGGWGMWGKTTGSDGVLANMG